MGTVLIHPSEVGGNGGTSVLLKIRDAGMQGQEFLRPAEILEADLAPFLLPIGPMGAYSSQCGTQWLFRSLRAPSPVPLAFLTTDANTGLWIPSCSPVR